MKPSNVVLEGWTVYGRLDVMAVGKGPNKRLSGWPIA